MKQDEFQEANKLYQKALTIFQQISDRIGIANSQWNLGIICGAKERPNEAERFLLLALSNFQVVGDRQKEAQILFHLGELYDCSGDKKKASEFFQEIIDD